MKKEEKYHQLLIIFLSIYPLFSLKIFYNSYFTLIQILIIISFLIGLLIIKKETRKGLKFLIIYYLLIIIYGIFHHYNALDFTSLVPGNFNYNLIKEILSLIKMSMPIPFIYIIYYEKLTRQEILKIIKSWLIFICGTIIISNILKLSLSSYSDTKIKGSILSWFTKNSK